MYLNFYQLKNEPFNVTPDPEFLFLSEGHKEALASIFYAVENRKGFMAITGEVGVGKTTILRSYIKEIDQDSLKTIYIINANLSFKGLLKTIFDELEIALETDEVFEMVNCLHLVLIKEYKKGHNFVIIIDEVQNMPLETLENLRMLSNLETSTDKLVQILLIGQPEFDKMLEQNNLRQLKQRIAVRSTLSPLTNKESIEYIRHRLAIVDADDACVFTKNAIKLIIKKAKGIPRILNILCDNALITGYGNQQRPVTSRTVSEVIADFEGKKKFSILRWGFALSIAFALLIGAFLFYPRKNNFLSIVNNKDLLQNNSIKLEKKDEVKPVVQKKTTESIKKSFTTITTLEWLTNPVNPITHLDKRNIVLIKDSDTHDKRKEEFLSSTNIAIEENYDTHTYVTKLEKEKQELERRKSIEVKEIKPIVEKGTTGPIKKNFTTITTLESLTSPIKSSTYLDNTNIVLIKNSDIYDDNAKEALGSTGITIDENYEIASYVTKLEKEKQVLDRLKSSYEKRVNSEMSKSD